MSADTIPGHQKDGRWARNDEEKAKVFAVHLSKGFEPHPREIIINEEKKLLITIAPTQMTAAAIPFIVNEVRAAIRVLNPKKAPDYDLITNHVLQKLPEKDIRFITQLYNAKYLDKAFFLLNGK